MTRKEKAENLFLEGYNCAQAVVLAFEDMHGLDRVTAARLSSSFGGGMVIITVLEKNIDSVTIKVAYRKNEKTMTVSTMSEEWFKDDANAYGFAFAFTVKE